MPRLKMFNKFDSTCNKKWWFIDVQLETTFTLCMAKCIALDLAWIQWKWSSIQLLNFSIAKTFSLIHEKRSWCDKILAPPIEVCTNVLLFFFFERTFGPNFAKIFWTKNMKNWALTLIHVFMPDWSLKFVNTTLSAEFWGRIHACWVLQCRPILTYDIRLTGFTPADFTWQNRPPKGLVSST